MRFGLFIPQELATRPRRHPRRDHWPLMRDLAQHADRGPWDSLWVYDHFHTVPVPTDEATTRRGP